MGKKILALLLALCMVVGVSACGTAEGEGQKMSAHAIGEDDTENSRQNDSGDDKNTQDIMVTLADTEDLWDEEPAEVNWYIWSLKSFTQSRLDAVNAAINEITLPKINVKVNLCMLEVGDYMNKVPLMVTAGDKIDLMTTFPAGSGTFTNMSASGQLMPLDELLNDYGQEMMDLFPEGYLETTKIDGNTYAVPIFVDQTLNCYWVCREEIFKETGLDAQSVDNLEDITDVFAAVKALHSDMKMISSAGGSLIGGNSTLITGACYDPLGTELAAVMYENGSDTLKVQCLFETDEFKSMSKVLRDWYAAGYVDEDIMIRETDTISDPSVFSWLLSGNDQSVINNRVQAGEGTIAVKLASGGATTSSAAGMCMGIPITATEPEAAAKLLNLLYTDAELKNLVNFGIEGEDYSFAENGGIVINEDSGYMPNCQVIFGNRYLDYYTEQEIENGLDKAVSDPKSVKRSPLYGFVVNTDLISTEAAQLSSVFQEYGPLVQCGLDNDAIYDEMLNKLYSSGLDAYLSELQRQLDEWLAQKRD